MQTPPSIEKLVHQLHQPENDPFLASHVSCVLHKLGRNPALFAELCVLNGFSAMNKQEADQLVAERNHFHAECMKMSFAPPPSHEVVPNATAVENAKMRSLLTDCAEALDGTVNWDRACSCHASAPCRRRM